MFIELHPWTIMYSTAYLCRNLSHPLGGSGPSMAELISLASSSADIGSICCVQQSHFCCEFEGTLGNYNASCHIIQMEY